MPLFQYQGYLNNKRIKGNIESFSAREAREKLRSEGVHIIKLFQASSKKIPCLKGENLLTFTIQLSQLINANIPVFESLQALQDQYRGEKYHTILISICDQIKSGSSLSEALSLYPESFNKIYCAMVAAGESSGNMGIMLKRLAGFIKKREQQKKQAITAMIYPGVLAAFTVVVIFLLMAFVVPSVREIFEERQVNTYTQVVLNISEFINSYWYIYLPLITAVILYLQYFFRIDAGKKFIDKFSLKIPLIKDLIIMVAISSYTRTAATLLQSGLGLIDSSKMSRKIIKNRYIAAVFKTAEENVTKGNSFSGELKKSELIPSLMTRMISIGEESGQIETMMENIADIYEDNLDKNITRITALTQPVILLVLGSVVGLVLLAVLLPFTDITSLSE